MALPEVKQATSVITRASSILLLVPPKPSADSFASMVALYVALLEQREGAVDAVSPSHVPQNLQFLPGSSQVTTDPKVQPDVILEIAGPSTVIDVRTEALSGGVRLHIIFPEKTEVTKENLETHVRQLPYDAVVTLGVSDLEELGDLFNHYADFFYNTPVVNIDNRATNEYFGTVNLVDITSSSIAELVHELLGNLSPGDITADIATALYAGIVSATDSFQKPSTTPQAFQLAAALMDKQADKETVIQNLVKTKPLHLLKLAGRTYARLRHDEHGKIFWSLLRPLDFQESGAKPEHIPDVMHELTNNISGYNTAFLLYEREQGNYSMYITLGKGLLKRRREIQEELGATKENGSMTVHITAPSFEDAEAAALGKIRSILP